MWTRTHDLTKRKNVGQAPDRDPRNAPWAPLCGGAGAEGGLRAQAEDRPRPRVRPRAEADPRLVLPEAASLPQPDGASRCRLQDQQTVAG